MKTPIRTSSEVLPDFPPSWRVRACYAVGFVLFAYFFFSGKLFAGLLWLVLLVSIGVAGSEHRRKEQEGLFWYGQLRSYYVIGLPDTGDIDIPRFDRLGFVVYTDNRNVTRLCVDIRQCLALSGNDKGENGQSVQVHGLIFDYGQRKGETEQEYAAHVEEKVWTMIRKEEKRLLRGQGQSDEQVEWYVKQGVGNDMGGGQHILK